MTDHDDLTGRLGALGSALVPDDVRAGHLHAMRAAGSSVAAPDERRRFGRVAVGAAAIVGFALGSTGFAMAGALPAPAQGVAHDVLSVVQVDVPDHPDNRGACVSAAAKAKDRSAKAECPKGGATGAGRSVDAPGKGGEAKGRPAEAGPHPNADTSDCKGKPAWAGRKGGPTEGEAATRAACAPEEAEAERAQPEELDQPDDPGARHRSGTAPEAVPPAAPADPAQPGDPADPAQPVVPAEPTAPPVDPDAPPAASDTPSSEAPGS